MLKNILAFGNTLSRAEQKSISGGRMLADNGDKQLGELCAVGSSLPHLSCGAGLTCISEGSVVGLCAVQL